MRTRLANIIGPSFDRSDVPHRFRYASYANPREFRTQKIRSEGRPTREGASLMGAGGRWGIPRRVVNQLPSRTAGREQLQERPERALKKSGIARSASTIRASQKHAENT